MRSVKFTLIFCVLLLTPLFTSVSLFGQASHTENFGCTNGTTPTGWTNLVNSIVCQSNQGTGSSAFNDNIAAYTGSTFGYDQDVKMTIKTFDGSNVGCVMVRSQDTGGSSDRDGYEFCTNGSSGAGNTFIDKFVTGQESLLENISTTFSVNDVMEIKVVGTTISAYKNGTQVGSNVTDGTFQTGFPGIYIDGTTWRVATWVGTDLSSSFNNKADAYFDFETSTNGTIITLDIATASVHPSPPWGSLALSRTPLLGSKISTSGQMNLGGSGTRSVAVDGTTYNDSGSTRGFQYDHSQGDEEIDYTYPGANGFAQVSVGFWFKTNLPANSTDFTGHSMSLFQIAAGGDYCVVPYVFLNGDNALHLTVETSNNLPASGGAGEPNYVTISGNTAYWITGLYDKTNDICKMNVYNTSFTQVGTTQSIALKATPDNTTFFGMGQNTGHTDNPSVFTYYDNFMLDWTNHTWPLFPTVAAQSCVPTMMLLGVSTCGD